MYIARAIGCFLLTHTWATLAQGKQLRSLRFYKTRCSTVPILVTNGAPRAVGYFTSWYVCLINITPSDCSELTPSLFRTAGRAQNGAECAKHSLQLSQMDATLYTHIIYAFFDVKPDFTISPPPEASNIRAEVQTLKAKNPNLQVLYAVGGWNFNENAATKHIFSDMVSVPANRQKFISSAMTLAVSLGLDGIDLVRILSSDLSLMSLT
jgi:GH18 family chitinase